MCFIKWLGCFLIMLASCTTAMDIPMFHRGPVTPYRIPTVIPVLIDFTFEEADRESIARAALTWNQTFNGSIYLRVLTSNISIADMLDPNAVLIMQVNSACTFIPTPEYATQDRVLAFVDKLGGRNMWIIRDRMDYADVTPLALHEFGHVFGAADRDGPWLMHKIFSARSYACIDQLTAAEVAGFQNLPLDTMSYCMRPIN